ncbi:MAG: TatD family hydrolase [bacterium]|nr:TatD family hydrolase [bacterium]
MLIDTHSHLNFKAFDEDRDEVIKKSLEQDVWIINASSNYKTSQLAVEIAQQYPAGVFASIGLHPINCVVDLSQLDEDRLEELDIEKYRGLSKEKGVVAIGEIGLDYWNEPKGKVKAEVFKEKQKEVFLKQLELAKELNLPVILHCRKAHRELLEELRVMNYELGKGERGVVHCFTGSWEEAQRYMELGFYLGFNGIIFKFDVDETIKKMPLEKMLLETDCPFLCPSSARCSPQGEGGQQDRNEPINIKYIAQKIAEIRGEPLEKIAEITTQNAKKLFNLS